METKQCSSCKEILNISSFSKSGRSTSNYRGVPHTQRYSSRCKPCAAEYSKEWRSRNKDYDRVRRRKVPLDADTRLLHSQIRFRLDSCKRRAKQYNKGFDIDFDYLLSLYTGRCAISGLPLSLEKGNPDVGSVDQIDPSKGYIRGNVQWLSWRVNRAKGDQSQQQFLDMCRVVLEGATTIERVTTE